MDSTSLSDSEGSATDSAQDDNEAGAGMIPDACPASAGSGGLGDATERRNNRLNSAGGPPAAPPPPAYPLHDPEGLIVPRKPANPCLESRGHKDLHRELLFNKKIGKSVLGQKSELQRALDRHKEHQVKKEEELLKEESQLERIIHERARRLEHREQEVAEERKPSSSGPEFLQVHAKLRARMDSK